MLKLVVYVPSDHLDTVKAAAFEAGAGRQGNYQHCAWQTLGTGQFKPMAGSAPYIGTEGNVEYVSEYRVEMLVDDALKPDVEAALRKAHPYEEPAIDWVQLLD